MTQEVRPLFVFGTLMDADVLQLVCGMNLSELTLQPAVANGFKRRTVLGESFPVLVDAKGESVSGVLVCGLSQRALQRAQFFEGEEYVLKPIHVEGSPESHSSQQRVGELEAVFFADNAVYACEDKDWSIQHWQGQDKAEFLPRLACYMSLFGSMSAAEADQHW